MKINIQDYKRIIERWAKSVVFQKEYDISEEADFGDFYGFAFKVKNKYNNAYLCIDKKSLDIFTFNPSQNIKLFKKRIVLRETHN